MELKFTFFCVISSNLNDLNIKLHSKEEPILTSLLRIKGFKENLKLFKINL